MQFQKIIALIPNVKRVSLPDKGKVKYSDGMAQFKTKHGKSVGVPEESVLYQDEKCIVYSEARRKIVKGEFVAEDGFLVDESSGSRIRASIITTSESAGKRTKAQKNADKARKVAMAKGKGSNSKQAAKSGFKLRIKK